MATQSDIGKHLDLSSRRVRSLVKDGILPSSSGPGGLDVDMCRIAYIKYLRGKISGQVSASSGRLDQHEERARLTHHQANIASLEEEQLRGNLLNAEEVAEAWGGVIANFRAKILALPMKLAAKLPGIDPTEVVQVSRVLSNEALDELAAYEIPEAKRGDTDGEIAA